MCLNPESMIYQPESTNNSVRPLKRGITVYTGPMYSGKTTALISTLERYTIAGINSVLFSPEKDARYSNTDVVTHSNKSHPAIKINNAEQIFSHLDSENKEPVVIGIDEAMMFDSNLIEVCSNLRRLGYPVFLSCCDMDVFLNPFKLRDWKESINEITIGNILAIANNVVKVTAICRFNENGNICGNEASFTRLKEGIDEAKFLKGVVVGSDVYEAVCDLHHPFFK
jgi:thymidine kinase